MNNNTVQNPKTELVQTPEMNDCDYLNDVLSTEKCISDNLLITHLMKLVMTIYLMKFYQCLMIAKAARGCVTFWH